MDIYFKILTFFIVMSNSNDAISQYVLCCKSEKVKFDLAHNEYAVLSTTTDYDSVVINKSHIQIKRKKIDLTKLTELSKWSDKNGITTIYETYSPQYKMVTVHVIETLRGISRIVVMDDPKSDYGTAYDIVDTRNRKVDE